jgi:hypothetical protein
LQVQSDGTHKEPNVPNEAKRLLKTNDITFSTGFKAKRLMKTNELEIKSQEVVDTKQVIYRLKARHCGFWRRKLENLEAAKNHLSDQ